MADLLEGMTAVVTGGASGNGRAIATTFAHHGSDVVVTDIRESPRMGGEPTHEVIRATTNRSAVYVECDVRDRDSFEPVMDAATELGGLDVMVNNAGIVLEQGEFTEVTPDSYREMMRVNVDGVYFGAQAAASQMLEDGTEGSIINMSSIAGIRGSGGGTSYATAKGAIRTFTYALADELGPAGIRVNVLHPGFHETAMTQKDVELVGSEEGDQLTQTIPLRRWGTPDDVAGAATFLASDLAQYVTAESLSVDGGIANTL